MEQRTLGGDGPAVSVVGLGCNNFGMKIDADATREVVHAALDAGITHFDTAEMYGGGKSEEFLGRGARGSARRGGRSRASSSPGRGRALQPGVLRQRIVEGVRDQPATPRHRPHRPLLPALPGPGGADRRGAGSADRPGRTGQGAAHRVVERRRPTRSTPPRRSRRSAGSRGSSARRSSGTCSTGRWRTDVVPAAVRNRVGRRAVLPARIGNAHGQVPAR